MPAFPLVKSLSVENYGLFPGKRSEPGLHVQFEPGMTLVLGANGLGKTTLVTILYRICTGPFDIPGLAAGRELGSRSIEAREISRSERQLLGVRVVDGAANARTTLS